MTMVERTLVLEAQELRKVYRRGSEEIAAVNDVSLQVAKGEFISFIGPSGSGKSTLINLLGCLDNASAGRLLVKGEEVLRGGRGMSEAAMTRIRRRVFGYVFQRFYLVPTLTLYENIIMPFAFYRRPGAAADPMPIIRFLGLEHRLHHRPGELSGGEMQRAAIARALVNQPEILLADEPTGNLDSRHGEEIGRIFKTLNEKEGMTVLLVTHNPLMAALAQRTITLLDGRIATS
jgi:putative ABC transport system ATP-binding protein